VRRGRPPWLVRITIDTPQGDGRVPIDRCAAVSREVGTQLDAEDAIERTYRLEVSSPGLSRLLARERDFTAACGTEVSLETRRPLDGRRRFRGRLESFDGQIARMLVDGVSFEIPFDEVAHATPGLRRHGRGLRAEQALSGARIAVEANTCSV
jgi:ribosome maturation factor RimP